MAEEAEVPPGVNLFTTLFLVDERTLRGHGSCGTTWQSELHMVPFTAPQTFKKTPRGNADYLLEAEKLIVRRNDNSQVTLVSNMEREFIKNDAKRWNQRPWSRSDSPSVSRITTHTWEEGTCMASLSAATESTKVQKCWWPCFSWALSSATLSGCGDNWCHQVGSFQHLQQVQAMKNCAGHTACACDVWWASHVECFMRYHTEYTCMNDDGIYGITYVHMYVFSSSEKTAVQVVFYSIITV